MYTADRDYDQFFKGKSSLNRNLILVNLLIFTRNTCTQQPLARLPNLFSVMLRLHTAINRADFLSW